jgi:hypothetical protein
MRNLAPGHFTTGITDGSSNGARCSVASTLGPAHGVPEAADAASTAQPAGVLRAPVTSASPSAFMARFGTTSRPGSEIDPSPPHDPATDNGCGAKNRATGGRTAAVELPWSTAARAGAAAKSSIQPARSPGTSAIPTVHDDRAHSRSTCVPSIEKPSPGSWPRQRRSTSVLPAPAARTSHGSTLRCPRRHEPKARRTSRHGTSAMDDLRQCRGAATRPILLLHRGISDSVLSIAGG